jgi:hypothetical protein
LPPKSKTTTRRASMISVGPSPPIISDAPGFDTRG